MIMSFHYGMMGNGSSLDPFPIKRIVKQGCILAPTIFGIFFSLLLRFAFQGREDGIFLHTRSDGNLFNLSHLRAKTKVHRVPSERCCLQTMPPSPRTPRKPLSDSSHALRTHAENSPSPSA
ncbi:hypothetical protein ElyMa_000879700 [Elysia marginata]|uniref:Uncharacterized protein n=1 Tax=Elysia marginata TaxID=1093978 RepID=A0AAV4H658_9GAST|nr:hypothetical protein ElyMa_000879700 [Elysia marginata]